jgi:L-alanine-DL-glutamate epimerase-like enolase superfamily enzyme
MERAMQIVDIRERTIPISRYLDPTLNSGGLTTSLVAVIVSAGNSTVTGYGFASMGRFGQGGLIRERFAPRLMMAAPSALMDDAGHLDPFRAWDVMMVGEKPGGHGERCVAVGTLDMALWDATAKLAGIPLWRHLADRFGRSVTDRPMVPVYASGGYPHPHDDVARLADEMRRLADLGYTKAKIKIGGAGLATDVTRIEAAATALGGARCLSFDAMNAYDRPQALKAAETLAALDLWWFEDVCDPLDFETLSAVAAVYPGPIGAGEALFSAAEARLLDGHGGLRRARDVLLFDPVHCYGIPGYLGIIDTLVKKGWPRSAFWPHGGHLFTLHIAAAFGLGGAEVNPLSFQPFGGLSDGAVLNGGCVAPPDAPGIGIETRADLHQLFRALEG